MLNDKQDRFIILHIYLAAKWCENHEMENKDIRKANLALLLDEHLDTEGNTKASFAELLGMVPPQLSQLLGQKSFRNIGDRMARKIEKSLGMPNGWMDTLHGESGRSTDVEYAGKPKNGYVRVIGEAVLGVNGSVDMIELHAGWLQMYSSDRDAYGLKVKGDSMFPRIHSGEYVLIEPNTTVHSGDEVFVRTKDGHNMIKVMTKTRDGSYQFSSVNNEHKPITLEPAEVEKMHFVSAIVKATRYLDHDDVLRQDNELA